MMEPLGILFFILLSFLAVSKLCDLIFGVKVPKSEITTGKILNFSVEYIYRLKNNHDMYQEAPVSEYESFGEEYAKWLLERRK